MRLWKLYVADDAGEIHIYSGKIRRKWDEAPWEGVQFLLVQLDQEKDGKSRVGWYRDNPGIWGEYGFYWWGVDGYPEGVSPDAVLDRWREKTGRTDVRLADLSLDDLRSIGVKIGRSIPSDQFDALLKQVLADPEIP